MCIHYMHMSCTHVCTCHVHVPTGRNYAILCMLLIVMQSSAFFLSLFSEHICNNNYLQKFTKTMSDKKDTVGEIEKLADRLKKEDGVKKNGTSDVDSRYCIYVVTIIYRLAICDIPVCACTVQQRLDLCVPVCADGMM